MKIIPIIISIFIAQLAGIIGSIFTFISVKTWYANLIRPGWNPPSWLFGPVWIILYILMGVAAYFVWQNKDIPLAKLALFFYGLQLLLNALWPIIFFGFKNPGLAFIEIIILSIFIIITTVLFWKINTHAGILLLPYILWTLFATFLNYAIWRLN